MKINLLSGLLLMLVIGCGDSAKVHNEYQNPLEGQPLADYEILLIGNSHSSVNGLPDLVVSLIENGLVGKSANATLAPGWGFLDERLDDGVTAQLLASRTWSHVTLQAQKYSTTGNYWYSTDAAEEWIRRVKGQNAIPILFPEWPRRGNFEEGLRVHNLHLDISSREPACVAPIGLAWDEAIAIYPELSLHASDGNHSSLAGALLTAYVLYQVITAQSAANLPYINEINVSAEVQQQLREIAAYIVENNIPC